jgi:hypothetical protein
MLTWFTEDELKRCPYCNARAAIPREAGPSVCLSCEIAWVDEPAETDG